jgi:TusA-related sulfurtransferase
MGLGAEDSCLDFRFDLGYPIGGPERAGEQLPWNARAIGLNRARDSEELHMATIKVNCVGETCPIPLVETRKALRNAQKGDVVEVTGTHPASKKEIPMAVKAMGLELLGVEDEGEKWTIKIRK